MPLSLLHIVSIFLKAVPHVSADCVLITRQDIPRDRHPLYLKDGTFLLPTLRDKVSTLVFTKNETIQIACVGKQNNLLSGGQMAEIRCLGGTLFSVDGKQQEFKDITCQLRVKAELRRTARKCFSSSSVLEIGFEADGWHRLIEVCHNEEAEQTVYAKHTLSHLTLKGSVRNSYRPDFKEGLPDLFHGEKIDQLFKKANQMQAVLSQLGRNDIMSKKQFLTRGHLAPDGDFFYSNWQHATYFFVNTAPQWASLNSGNWLRLESKVKSLAAKLGTDLQVTTGTLGVLQLNDINGNLQEIYLQPWTRRIPVPKYFWKHVHSPAHKKSITFVMYNNPFNYTQSTPCSSVCEETNWVFSNSSSRGVVICCSHDSLKTFLPFIKTEPTTGTLYYTR